MSEPLNQHLAERATELVEHNFTGVRAPWWWERRLGGGIAVCQELDPQALARDVAAGENAGVAETWEAIKAELGVEDLEPVVLTFEIPGDTSSEEAARLLSERSATPEGLAAGLYRRVGETVRRPG